ncbi:MAG: hypothetical protein KDA74_25550 [Planctomycetaceae bacterium]|nr:hypothetical protein [Planctomycetaceae bacterium]
MSLPPFELPPLKGNGLFRLANDDGVDYPIACIGLNGGRYTMGDYAQGYFFAGDRLIESIRHKRCDLDVLIYPVVYVYRHGIELSLKYLAERIPVLLGHSGEFTWGHELLQNWRQVRELLVQTRTDYPGERSIKEKTLRWVDGVLRQFAELDPGGVTFRYPTDSKGKNRLIRRSHVNYMNFYKDVKPLSEQFVRWMSSIDEMIAQA